MSESAKKIAGHAALAEVSSGMLLGLGSGSTARHFFEALAAALASGDLRDVRGVPTSRATEKSCRELGIPLVELPAAGVDLAIDGADEIDAELNAIKGLGGALLREKVVAASATRFVLIADDGKRVDRLGERAPLPIEVLGFGIERTRADVGRLGLESRLRGGDLEPFLSDNGHPILDATLPAGVRPDELARDLEALPGVLGHGLFLGLANVAYVADDVGAERLEPRS